MAISPVAATAMPTSLSLQGKTAIVTGYAHGIGAATALKLAERGANIALCFVSDGTLERSESVAKEIRALGRRAVSINVRLESADCGQTIVSAALVGLDVSVIDIIVNNGAAEQDGSSCATGFDDEVFQQLISVNVRAPTLLMQAALPHMPAQGGRIISLSSIQVRQPQFQMELYAASKAALECLSRYWASELGRSHGLTSNVIEVGPIENEHFAIATGSELDFLQGLASAGRRLGSMDDLAEIVAFLASDAARWINGETVNSSGGSSYM